MRAAAWDSMGQRKKDGREEMEGRMDGEDLRFRRKRLRGRSRRGSRAILPPAVVAMSVDALFALVRWRDRHLRSGASAALSARLA